MRIAILAHNLRVAGGLSVGKNIVALLPKVGPNHDYLMIVPKGLGYAAHSGQKNVAVNEIPVMAFIKRIRFDLFYLPKLIKNFNPDMILGLGNLGLQKPRCKQAILFHKSQLSYPLKHYSNETYTARFKNWMLKQRLKMCLRGTQLVFCQTPVARERFASAFDYPPDQIRIMPNAVSEFSKTGKERTSIPEVFGNKDYFSLFFLTKFYAHKNLETLIDIFRFYNEKLRNVRCIVTISAEQHPNATKFLENIRRWNLEKHIINVGPLKQTELAGYFYNCEALLLPTLLESFSGTYLEAMHFGLPILTSDLDFARYVCGDAALYFDPWSPADIVEKILLLKNNCKLKDDLISRGRKRISNFFESWEEITADVIKDLEYLFNQE